MNEELTIVWRNPKGPSLMPEYPSEESTFELVFRMANRICDEYGYAPLVGLQESA